MKRWAALLYGISAYAIASAVVLYFVCFLGNSAVRKSIDSSAPQNNWVAAAIDSALLLLFGLQHSVMARPGFKTWWVKMIPPPIERSTYVLFSSAALAVLCWLWQPLPDVVWEVSNATVRWLIHGSGAAGALLAVISTFAIDHFDLMGVRQVVRYWRAQPSSVENFSTPGPYRWIRHPIMLGLLVAFWAVPTMTVGHLLLSLVMSAYILIAIRLEERDLVQKYGDRYRQYQRSVGMLLPTRWLRWRTQA